jgi:hypothetical protein
MPWFFYKLNKFNLMRVPWNRTFSCKERLGKICVLSSGEHHSHYSLFLSLNGVRILHPNCGMYCPIACASNDVWILRSTGGVTMIRENRNARRRTSSSSTFSTKLPLGLLWVWKSALVLIRWPVPTYTT